MDFERKLITISRRHKVRRADDHRALRAINEFLDGIDATGQREALHLVHGDLCSQLKLAPR